MINPQRSTMKSIITLRFWICLSLFVATASGCQMRASHKLVGDVELNQEQLKTNLPKHLPKVVYVADFDLDSANFSSDQGVRGALPNRLQKRFEGLGQNLPTPLATGDDPAQAVQQIVDEMADSITKGLKAKGVPAERLGPVRDTLPTEGWMISGVFTEVDEGNRLKRAVMGFGKGATQMEVQVGISDLQSETPRTPFAIFGTIKDPSKQPGAAVTKNPYVAAARFIMEKNATTRDIQNTAGDIIDELLKFRDEARQAMPR